MKLKQVKEIVSCLRYKDWWFFIRTRKGEMYLQVEFVARDSGSGPAAMQKGRKWFVSKHATESELVFTALKAVLTAEEHEAREEFRYLGRAIVNPHISVKTLWRVAKRNRQKETMNGFIYVDCSCHWKAFGHADLLYKLTAHAKVCPAMKSMLETTHPILMNEQSLREELAK